MNVEGGKDLQAQDMQLQSGQGPSSGASGASQVDQASWFEAMARAWGQSLEREQDGIQETVNEMQTGQGDSDSVENKVELQAQIQRFSFLSSASSNTIKTAGDTLDKLARRN